MTSITSPASGRLVLAAKPMRFGREAAGGGSVEWILRRNCSIAPRQMLAFYASLCVLSLSIASAFWMRGALLVMPFAGVELLAVGIALLVYARHAADRDSLRLAGTVLTVECTSGLHTVLIDMAPAFVRVEPATSDRSLIELTDRGRRVSVGRFVRPELRRALADELRGALRRWQHEPRASF